jgi:hypothetical protein
MLAMKWLGELNGILLVVQQMDATGVTPRPDVGELLTKAAAVEATLF